MISFLVEIFVVLFQFLEIIKSCLSRCVYNSSLVPAVSRYTATLRWNIGDMLSLI